MLKIKFVQKLICSLVFFAFGWVALHSEQSSPRYIFFFIGDGMGEILVEAAEKALSASDGSKSLSFTKFPVKGYQKTSSANSKVTDSAAAATAIACGVKTNNGTLGIAPDGRKLDSIAVIANRKGWKVGIITSVSIDHATPAGFYARSNSRYDNAKIAKTLAESNFQFFGGGGMEGQKNPDSEEDNLQLAIKNGFQIVRTREKLKETKADKIYAFNHRLAREASLPWVLEYKEDDITLAEFTAAAIENLKDSNFFIMVEGGKIDWACHNNDLANAISELIHFDMAVREALKFMEANPNTLIVVTADHETGGIEKILNPDAKPETVLLQKITAEQFSSQIKKIINQKNTDFNQCISLFTKYFGIYDLSEKETEILKKAWLDELTGKEEKRLYGKLRPTTSAACKIIAERAGYRFTSPDHTAADVPVYAIGLGSEEFSGTYENTEIFFKIKNIIEPK